MDNKELFNKIKKSILAIDPVAFIEENLTLEGNPFKINGSGYKPFSDIYRYIGIKALEPSSKPVIIVKGRQVGGTTMASALEMYFMGSGLFGVNGKPPIRVIHTFPQLSMSAAYAKTKLNPMIAQSVMKFDGNEKKTVSGKSKSFMQSMLDVTGGVSDSLEFKPFINGNHIWIESIGLEGNRLRGKTADVMFFDEVQDTTSAGISAALKVLTTAKYGESGKGVRIYFGTPKKQGSDFHKMWQTSSQQYYHLGCDHCHKYFPLYTPGSDDWEKIWLYGFIVKCTFCGKEQDKRSAAERGKWIAYKDDNDRCDSIGFHINQLYMPLFTKESIMAEKPGTHPFNTERSYQNEVLGEFYQGDSSPITDEEIREKCGDFERKFRGSISPGEEVMVVLGLDYGLKSDLTQAADENKKQAGQSYSTAVVLAVKNANILSIEYAMKFKKNDLQSKKIIIDKLMKQFSINLAVGDIGYSNDLSTELHTMYGDKYIVSRAHPKVNGYVKYLAEAFPKEIIFQRDDYIAEMYDQLKNGSVRFPLGSYENVAWLINHCTSMELKPSLSRAGEPKIHYVKGSGPNDGFMALLNAYLAYKFLVTKGFTIKNPMLQMNNFRNMNKTPVCIGHVKL